MQHTPTPWSVETPMDEEFAIVQSGLEAYEWQFIAVCPVGTSAEGAFSRQRAKLNAAFIVKACNSHEALVKALSSVLSAWDALPPGLYSDAEMTEWINSPSMKGAISNAREALALTSAHRATVGGEK